MPGFFRKMSQFWHDVFHPILPVKNGLRIEENGAVVYTYVNGKKQGISFCILKDFIQDKQVKAILKDLKKGRTTMEQACEILREKKALEWICPWKDDTWHGTVFLFDFKGNLRFEANYVMGEQSGPFKEYLSGQLIWNGEFEDGKFFKKVSQNPETRHPGPAKIAENPPFLRTEPDRYHHP